jgi:hypothetical protein
MKAENFIEKSIIEKWYSGGDFHKVYVLHIEHAYIKE